MNFEEYIQILSNSIRSYVDMGGDFYSVSQDKLPYYGQLHTAKQYYAKENNGERLSTEQVHAICGFTFDKEFDTYTKFLDKLKKCADEKGVIKFDRRDPFQSSVRGNLMTAGERLNLQASEYLILMTPYRPNAIFGHGDYEECIARQIKERYSKTDDVVGMRHHNTKLYNKIQHVRIYNKETKVNDVLEANGKINSSAFKMQTPCKPSIPKPEVIKALQHLYPNCQVRKLEKIDPKLYYEIIQHSIENNQSVSEWLMENGFIGFGPTKTTRFQKYKMEPEEQEEYTKQLLTMKEEMLSKFDLTSTTPEEKYHIETAIAKQIGMKLRQEDGFIFKRFYNLVENRPLLEKISTQYSEQALQVNNEELQLDKVNNETMQSLEANDIKINREETIKAISNAHEKKFIVEKNSTQSQEN